MPKVLFSYGLQSQYEGVQSKDTDTLYFITDTQRIYKGDTLISDVTHLNVSFVDAIPEVGSAQEDILYVATVGGSTTLWVKNGESLSQVGGGEATEVADGVLDIGNFQPGIIVTDLSNPNDTTIPTTKAVSDAITEALADYDGAIVNVSADRAEDNNGTVLTFTPKSGEPITVTVADFFLTSASYNNETHELSLSVQGVEAPVTVNLEDLIPQAVNASQVAIAREITVTTDVGNLHAGDKVIITGDPQSGEVKAADVQALFEAILSKDINPTTTQPSASVTLSNSGAKEVGTEFTPSYSCSLNPGTYNVAGQGNQATNVTATAYEVSDTNSNNSSTQSGSFTAFTVEDSTNYKVSVTISHSAGSVPKTFLGNEYPTGQIQAGQKSANSATVTGYRNCWWGYKTSSNLIADPAAITAQEIKALGNANRTRPTSLQTNQMQQMFFALPADQVSGLSIAASTGLPQTVQGPITVSIGGVNDYSPIDYDVFYVSNAAAEAGSETFTLTWN